MTISFFIAFAAITWVILCFFHHPTTSFFFGIIGGVFISSLCSPFGINSGISIIWLIITLLSLFFVKFRYKIHWWNNTLEEYSMILLFLAILYSFSYTQAPQYGKTKFLLFSGSCLPLFFLGRMCGSKPKIMLASFKNGVILAHFTVWYYLIDFIIAKNTYSTMYRYGSGMSIMFGIFLNSSIAILLFSVFRHNGKKQILSIISMMAALCIIPFTGSRGAILIPLFTSMLTFLTLKRLEKSITIAFVLICITLIFFRIFAPTVLKQRMDSTIDETSGRYKLFSIAIDIISKHPIQGIGVGGFSRFNVNKLTGEADDRRSYPHNLWLEIGSEQGILGLLPLLVLTVTAIFNLYKIRRLKVRGLSESVQMLFWVCLFQACFTSDLPAFRGFFLMCGFLSGSVNQSKRQIRPKLKRYYEKSNFNCSLMESKFES